MSFRQMYAESGFPSHTTEGSVTAAGGLDQEEKDNEEDDVIDPSFLSNFDDNESIDYGGDEPTPDLYAVLGVAKDASEADIRAAYHRLSRFLHPDKHIASVEANSLPGDGRGSVILANAEAAFGRLTTAYNILCDPHKRAIYDQYGFQGLRMQGWELAVRDKSAPELRLEYLLLKAKAKEEDQKRFLQAESEFSVGIDLTDLFDRYLQDPPQERVGLPFIYMSEVSLSQSITVCRTLRHTVSLAGQVSARNGIGAGTLIGIWQRRLSAKTPLVGAGNVETLVSCGRGGRGLGVGVKLYKDLHDRLSGFVGLEVAQMRPTRSNSLAIIPGANIGFTFQVAPRIYSRLQYAVNLSGGLSSEVWWISEKGERSCRLHCRLSNLGEVFLTTRFESTVDWAWLNPFRPPSSAGPECHKCPEWVDPADEEEGGDLLATQNRGRVSVSVGCNSYDLFEARLGVNCILSELTRLSGEISASWMQGIGLKLGLHRGGQSYSLPIRLSDNRDLAALGYGTIIPILIFGVVRSLVYDPWMRQQIRRLQEVRRRRLRDQLQQLRGEAMATQALMQHASTRVASAEKAVKGLVIVKALYGQLRPGNPAVPPEPDDGGPLCLDVTAPLQVAVENHQLRLPPGRWADLQGFYDPCAGLTTASAGGLLPMTRRLLFVAYSFNGLHHEVVVDETQGLAIPMAKHRVAAHAR
uniref:J domain-containing protein n=1 Tax=Schistocephalus solidus TaxID=70667 RepID=A0A0X3PIQ1_SCHSO